MARIEPIKTHRSHAGGRRRMERSKKAEAWREKDIRRLRKRYETPGPIEKAIASGELKHIRTSDGADTYSGTVQIDDELYFLFVGHGRNT